MKIKNIFVTGPIQIGKSTVILKVIDQLQAKKIGGFKTKPLYENKIRVGFTIQSFQNSKRIFAHKDWRTPFKFDVYYYDPEIFETFGTALLENAIRESQFIVIDEIGKMEARTNQFKKAVQQCLDSPLPVLGAFQKRAEWFEEVLAVRKDTRIFKIEEDNRETIDRDILKFF